MKAVYLDHASATPVLPEVIEAMKPFFSAQSGSPSSFHQAGLIARDALAKARAQVAEFVHAESPENIVFTANNAEAANLAIIGSAFANERHGKHIVTSAIEHPAVLGAIDFLETRGFSSTRVAVDREGRVALDAVKSALRDDTVLISLHLANHDVGVIQQVARVGQWAHERGIPLYVDASHAAGWLPVDVQLLGASLLSFSSHRFYGPKGVGVLFRHRRARLTPLIHGGIQEYGYRAGSENLPAIVGAGLACEIAAKERSSRVSHVSALQRKLWEGLKAKISHIHLNGTPLGAERSCTHLNFSIEFVEGEGLMLLADTRGFAFASGSACVSKAINASPVLTAMGVEHALALGAVILTLGKDNTEEEIDRTIATLPLLAERLRAMSPAWDEFQKTKHHSVAS